MNEGFALYPEARHWWSLSDYGAVLGVMRRLQPKRVLEFGPGSSTLALVEGGAVSIDTCEDDPDWEAVYRERLEQRFPTEVFPTTVTVQAYTFSDPLSIPGLNKRRWDLALIDGPHGTLHRPAVIAWCLPKCKAVLVPTEDVAYGQSALRPHIQRLADEYDRQIEWMETGPLSGGFALLTKKTGRPMQLNGPGALHGTERVIGEGEA